jgi:hypothetical protein
MLAIKGLNLELGLMLVPYTSEISSTRLFRYATIILPEV